jgi:uncharacterized protein (DUF1684 family)
MTPTTAALPRRLRSLLTTVATLSLAIACSSGPPPPATSALSHADRVQQSRVAKDEAFRLSDDSPIPAADRATFPGLNYFPIDTTYNVPASIVEDRAAEPVIIELALSDGSIDRLARVGTITFRLQGATYTLTAFAAAADGLNRLFVPFGDLTNREDTYGGGRYLNLDRTPTGLYDLDFNMAYNPNCVYDVRWSCPLPPPENRLQVAIRAGERLPAGYK